VLDPLTWVRAIHFLALVMASGAVFFSAFVAEPALQKAAPDARLAGRVRIQISRIAWAGLAAALISGAAWLVLTAEEISDRDLAGLFSDGIIRTVLAQTGFGHGWLARLVLIGLLAAVLPWEQSSRQAGYPAAAVAALMVGTLAWASHAAGTEGIEGAVHFAADVLHLVAAAAWVGMLVPIALLLRVARHAADANAHEAAQAAVLRFSSLGVASVATILATGLINTWFLVGSVPALVGTDYGRLLLVKVALFLAMVSIAAVNRFWLRPRLIREGNIDALRQIERNSAVEAVLGVAILAIVGVLGTMVPGLHQQPLWPVSVRVNGGIFAEPDFYMTIIFGAAWIALGIYMRRFRWPAIAIGVAIFALLGWRLPISEAYPTTFYASSTGFSAQSIAKGENLFAAQCASCHGADAHGDGPAAASLKTKPADLTADHVYEHTDGDLFWWITHGINTGMPAFGDRLDEDGRWSLIDFLHANADATRLRALGAGTTAGFPAPEFSVECPGGVTASIEQFRPQILHIVMPGPRSDDWLRAIADRDRGAKLHTIVLAAQPAAARALSLCVAQEPATIQAFAHYRGSEPVEGIEFLVDAEGNLRSMWRAEDGASGRGAESLELRVRGLRTPPRVRRPSGMQGHTHTH